MTENIEYQYAAYASLKKLIKNALACKDGCDHTEEPSFKGWVDLTETMEKIYPDMVATYERRHRIISSFTYEQRDHICYMIGEWYLMMKPLLEGQHNLGYMKEQLKIMICGD